MAAKKKKVKKQKKAAETEEGKKNPRDSITTFVRNMFRDDPECETQDIIDGVLEKWPKSKINSSHISFYKNKFRKEGMDIPFARKKKEAVEEQPKPKKKKRKKASA